jgi:NTP pyrophosphatase (non-canonical NTP hydrolase)
MRAGGWQCGLRKVPAARLITNEDTMANELTLNEYQTEAIKTLQPTADATYLAAKLMVEAAEVAQPIIKLEYHGKKFDVDAVEEELGDVLWYLATLADAIGLSLGELAERNIAKLRARHGETYNPAHYRTLEHSER